MRLQRSKFHFVGVGGIGMCGLAELLKNMGAQVSGSDLSENANTDRLKGLGVTVHKGHRKENVGDVDVLVYSSAVSMDNPEMQEALARQIPLIPRAEALAEIMHLKRGVAVAGTHGKTTTTSMTASIFLAAKVKPTIVVGGRLDLIQSTALLGTGEWMVVEADESDGSFSKLSPEIAIITNIDSDHLDYYKSFDNLKNAFLNFALKIPFYGSVIVWGDDPSIREIFQRFPKRVLMYGFEPHNDFVLKGEKGRYELFEGEKSRGFFEVHIPGKHNALNAAASMIAGLQAGFSFETCAEGLRQFSGVDRRFQLKGEAGGVQVFDDYGHHPTEVRAALQGFREKFPDRRLVVMFQPHRYSRTQICWHEFTTCFSQCDELILTDIYAAGEAPIDGITSERLVSEVKHGSALYLKKDGELSAKIKSQIKPGDVFVTLGAGDGWKVGLELLQMLK
ncbi:MAG: UDP-N-acetylmuramate--L-alanine ligase [Bdellovibrionaceae bacterium]|nr:UDP-N-acetylmuramate--L-alanine ligase [Pseudobdellovibrionaceae bacterium]